MARERVQTRCNDDTVAAIEAYRKADDTPDISDAETVRRLLRAGLAAKGHPVAGHSDSILIRARHIGRWAIQAGMRFLGIKSHHDHR